MRSKKTKQSNSVIFGKPPVWMWLFCTLLFNFASPVLAQLELANCSQRLRAAEKKFELGNLREVPLLLNDCLKDGFSTEEKATAYKLLSLTYLYLDDSVNAEKSFLYLLKNKPDFKVNALSDPAELNHLHKSFRTLPLYSFGIHAGFNVVQVHVVNHYGIDNTTEVSESYQVLPGFQGGINFEVPLSKKFFISAEPTYKHYRYKYSKHLNTTNIHNENVQSFNFATVHFREAQSWFHLPVILSKTIINTKVQYFVSGGASAGFLLGSNAEVKKNLSMTSGRNSEIIGPAVPTTNIRNRMNYWAIIGGGAKIKTGLNYVFIEARYHYGLFNIVNPNKRFDITNLWNDYGHLDNDFKINSIELTGSYMITKYKPKRIFR